MTQYPTQLRNKTESDEPFIYSTWLKSYRQSEFAKNMSNDVFFLHHKQIVKSILNHPTTQVTMICDVNDSDQIFGYIVAQVTTSQTLVHYVYCKYNFRKLSIISTAIQSLGYFAAKTNFITHLPRAYHTYQDKYNLEYDPYLLGDL